MTMHLDHITPDDLPDDLRQIAELIGMDALMALSRQMGGNTIYFPRPERLAVAARNRAIRSEFDGGNHRDLARRYNLSVTWIRKILSCHECNRDDAA